MQWLVCLRFSWAIITLPLGLINVDEFVHLHFPVLCRNFDMISSGSVIYTSTEKHQFYQNLGQINYCILASSQSNFINKALINLIVPPLITQIESFFPWHWNVRDGVNII